MDCFQLTIQGAMSWLYSMALQTVTLRFLSFLDTGLYNLILPLCFVIVPAVYDLSQRFYPTLS